MYVQSIKKLVFYTQWILTSVCCNMAVYMIVFWGVGGVLKYQKYKKKKKEGMFTQTQNNVFQFLFTRKLRKIVHLFGYKLADQLHIYMHRLFMIYKSGKYLFLHLVVKTDLSGKGFSF